MNACCANCAHGTGPCAGRQPDAVGQTAAENEQIKSGLIKLAVGGAVVGLGMLALLEYLTQQKGW